MASQQSELTVAEPDHSAEDLYKSLRKWKSYPDNLGPSLEPRNRPRLIEQIKRHFERTKYNSLFILDESLTDARKNAIERKLRTSGIWFDCDAGLGTPRSAEDSGDGEKEESKPEPRRIKTNKELEQFLGIKNARPNSDPAFRFIVLESSAPASPRLKITDEMLLKILTYHQVTPYFLDHISHICHEPPTGVTEAPFSGFRSLKSFSSSPSIFSYPLGRSGLHYQLVFELKTVIDPSNDGASSGTSGEDLYLWPITQCAVYHRFDLSTGKSLWILTPPSSPPSSAVSDSNINAPWNRDGVDSHKLLSHFGVPFFTPISNMRCLSASLSILTWFADWSLSEFDTFISTLDEQMQDLALPYINAQKNGPIFEITLKRYNQYMETLDQCIAALESNLSTLQALVAFYSYDDLLADKHQSLFPLWLTDSESKSEINQVLDEFRTDMLSVCATYHELISRAGVVKQMGTRRESTTHRLLQNRDTMYMKQLQKLTYIFSTITLLLLPMSVVSTIFSTDIVKFSDPDRANTAGYVGSWSGPAGVWWLMTTLLATGLVGGFGEWWRRKSSRETTGGVANPIEGDNSDGEGKIKQSWNGVIRWVKRGYGDLEAKRGAKVQWVTGHWNVARMKLAITRRRHLGDTIVSGEGDEEVGSIRERDPERADSSRG